MIPPEVRERLLQMARDAARQAYCPYSHFHVGAAVWMDGELIPGCNVENASYGLTICAERVAIFSAIAQGKKNLQAIAVACVDAPADGPPESRMPCGACRQVMAEFARDDTLILIDGVGEFTLADLLPHAFKF